MHYFDPCRNLANAVLENAVEEAKGKCRYKSAKPRPEEALAYFSTPQAEFWSAAAEKPIDYYLKEIEKDLQKSTSSNRSIAIMVIDLHTLKETRYPSIKEAEDEITGGTNGLRAALKVGKPYKGRYLVKRIEEPTA